MPAALSLEPQSLDSRAARDEALGEIGPRAEGGTLKPGP
jgi:hypothetical protein